MTRNMDEGRAHPGGARESTYTCCTPALDTQPTHARTDSSPCATHMGKRMRPSSVCVRGSSWSIECGKEGAEWRQRGGKGEEAALQFLLLLLLPLRWSLPRETSPRESRGPFPLASYHKGRCS